MAPKSIPFEPCGAVCCEAHIGGRCGSCLGLGKGFAYRDVCPTCGEQKQPACSDGWHRAWHGVRDSADEVAKRRAAEQRAFDVKLEAYLWARKHKFRGAVGPSEVGCMLNEEEVGRLIVLLQGALATNPAP